MKENPDKSKDMFLYIWENAISGKYVAYSEDISDYTHVVINVPVYTHFTSPIRRIVDIYNQISWIRIQEKKPIIHLDLDLEKTNKKNKKIKKLEEESKILSCVSCEIGKRLKCEILKKEEKRGSVYICEYKMILNVKMEKNEKMEKECSIYVFERESDYRKKIKLEFSNKPSPKLN